MTGLRWALAWRGFRRPATCFSHRRLTVTLPLPFAASCAKRGGAAASRAAEAGPDPFLFGERPSADHSRSRLTSDGVISARLRAAGATGRESRRMRRYVGVGSRTYCRMYSPQPRRVRRPHGQDLPVDRASLQSCPLRLMLPDTKTGLVARPHRLARPSWAAEPASRGDERHRHRSSRHAPDSLGLARRGILNPLPRQTGLCTRKDCRRELARGLHTELCLTIHRAHRLDRQIAIVMPPPRQRTK